MIKERLYRLIARKEKSNDCKQADKTESTKEDQDKNTKTATGNGESKNMSENAQDQKETCNAEQQHYEKKMSDEGENYNNKNGQQAESKTARLMTLIGNAIEEWAKEYHMESMPKSIIFSQALDAMRAMEPLFKYNQNEHRK